MQTRQNLSDECYKCLFSLRTISCTQS